MFLTELFRGTRSHYATNVCQGQTRITISRGACRVCRGAAKNQPFTTYVVYIVRTLCNISARFLLNQPESQCFIAVHYAFAAVSVFFLGEHSALTIHRDSCGEAMNSMQFPTRYHRISYGCGPSSCHLLVLPRIASTSPWSLHCFSGQILLVT